MLCRGQIPYHRGNEFRLLLSGRFHPDRSISHADRLGTNFRQMSAAEMTWEDASSASAPPKPLCNGRLAVSKRAQVFRADFWHLGGMSGMDAP